MAKVLVTGATGYIAQHIILQLLEQGHVVRASVWKKANSQKVLTTIGTHISKDIELHRKLEFTVLDLNKDIGWDRAMQGIDALIHTASPVPLNQPKDENKLIRPAVDGTLRALNAAHKAGVKRVVFTSSIAAIMGNGGKFTKIRTENDWCDIGLKNVSPYTKSKTLAERAAWDFVAREDVEIDLTTINPGFVFGAPLEFRIGASLSLIRRLLRNKDIALPNSGFVCVDVNDVAQMHVTALETKASFGNRYIAVGGHVWLSEIVNILAAEFPNRKLPTRNAPNWLIRLLGMAITDLKYLSDDLGIKREASTIAAQTDLNIQFRNVKQSIIETAHYMIDNKLV